MEQEEERLSYLQIGPPSCASAAAAETLGRRHRRARGRPPTPTCRPAGGETDVALEGGDLAGGRRRHYR
jgi:hypothetical protein